MGLSIKWLGRACFRILADDKVIYTDPGNVPYVKTEYYKEKADIILSSHSHGDHCDKESIDRIRKKNTVILAPAECASNLGSDMKTVKPGDTETIGNIKVDVVQAYNVKHFRETGEPYHLKDSSVGYIIRVGGKTIYHTGDTDLIPEMKRVGKIDIALMPIGGAYTMDASDAVEAALMMKPEIVVPMHILTDEENKKYNIVPDPEGFKKTVESKSKIKVVVLKVGEDHKFY